VLLRKSASIPNGKRIEKFTKDEARLQLLCVFKHSSRETVKKAYNLDRVASTHPDI